MDRQTTKRLAEASEKALKAVADEFGVAVRYKSGSYDSNIATLRFEFAEVSADGAVHTRESAAFTHLARAYGLRAEMLGAEFKVATRTYTITGLNTRASKMPIQATRDDGRSFKFPAEVVAKALGVHEGDKPEALLPEIFPPKRGSRS